LLILLFSVLFYSTMGKSKKGGSSSHHSGDKQKREPSPPSEDFGDSEYLEEEFSSESEGWLGVSTNSWVVRVWKCGAEGKRNILIFRLRIALRGGVLNGLLWKTMASSSPPVGKTARCAHSKLD
jgi:hypothetical protein